MILSIDSFSYRFAKRIHLSVCVSGKSKTAESNLAVHIVVMFSDYCKGWMNVFIANSYIVVC